MESKRKTTPLSSSVPPSKRVHGNLHSPPVPSKPAITIAGGEEDEEEGDVDVFMEELLLRDEELRESGIEGLTSRLSKWRRPSLEQDVQKHNIGMSLDSVSRFFFSINEHICTSHDV